MGDEENLLVKKQIADKKIYLISNLVLFLILGRKL